MIRIGSLLQVGRLCARAAANDSANDKRGPRAAPEEFGRKLPASTLNGFKRDFRFGF